MANRTTLAAVDNETRIATTRTVGRNGVFFVEAPAGKASVIALQDTAGETWYLFVDTTGDLRIHTADPSAPDSDGDVVGGQS